MKIVKHKTHTIKIKTVRAKNPVITINRVKKILDNLNRKHLEITISEWTPNKAGQKPKSVGYSEVKSMKLAIKNAKKKVHIKTATFGGRPRFYKGIN